MRNVGLKTPTGGDKRNDRTNSEKKLIQARLPFKIVSPSVAKESEGTAKNEGRKRKLSNENDGKPKKLFCNQEVKENLSTTNQFLKDKSRSTENENTVDEHCVVILSDDSQHSVKDVQLTEKIDKPKELVAEQTTPNLNSNILTSAKSKLKIKLTFGNKNKKRKSGRLNESSTSIEETENSGEETVIQNLNPIKKPKLLKDLKGQPVTSGLKINLESDVNPNNSNVVDTHTNELNRSENNLNKRAENEETEIKLSTTKGTFDVKHKTDTMIGTPCKVEGSKMKNKFEGPKTKQSAKKITTECKVNLVRLKINRKVDVDSGSNYSDDSIIIADDECKEDCSKIDGKSEDDLEKSVNLSLTEEETVKLVAKTTTPTTKKKLEKRQRLKEERNVKLQKAKEDKIRAKEEKELEKKKEREEKELEKKKEKEEKENQRKKEKEEKDLKRLAEIEAKNEEKRKKEEAKEEERRKKDEAREEDRRKKEDEKRRKDLEREEAENKKKKASEAFTKFFVAPKSTKTIEEEQKHHTNDTNTSLAFRPFQVKCDMKLAPTVRKTLNKSCTDNLDMFIQNSSSKTLPESELYLAMLREKKIIPSRYIKLTPNDEEDCVQVYDELEGTVAIDETHSPIQKYRSKYFLFHENRRPPFHGTWRKKSKIITPKRPLSIDKEYFDYEVDSDDEWEEEDPGGESLNGTDDEKESEDDDYEVDNELFVPHGHLSDEELQSEEEQLENNSRELQKAKLMLLQQEFAQEMKKKTEKIKPRLIGTVWEGSNGDKPELCPDIIWDYLNKRAMMLTEPPILEEPAKPEPVIVSPQVEKPVRLKLNEDLIKALIRLVHGNRHNKVFLIQEFLAYACKLHKIEDEINLGPRKSTVRDKIDEIAEWTAIMDSAKKNKKKLCWIVSADILKKFSMDDLDTKNQWTYLLEPKKKNKTPMALLTEKEIKEVNNEIGKPDARIDEPVPAISITKNELMEQNNSTQTNLTQSTDKVNTKTAQSTTSMLSKAITTESPAQLTGSSTSKLTPKTKKRVPLLMSVKRGDEVPLHKKNALISKFLQKNKKTELSKTLDGANKETDSSSDVILIE